MHISVSKRDEYEGSVIDVDTVQLRAGLIGRRLSGEQSRGHTVTGRAMASLVVLAMVQGCGDDDSGLGGTTGTGGVQMTGGSEQTSGYAYSACDFAERVGGFTIVLGEDGTTVNGKVTDSVEPGRIPEAVTVDGECTLQQGRQLFCDPECSVGEVCRADESGCQAAPAVQSAGDVSIAGLSEAVAVSPREPKKNYVFPVLTNPAFEEGREITSTAAGAETLPALSWVAEGIAKLDINETELTLEAGQPAVLTWAAPARAGRSRIRAELNLSLHGGDPVRIECDGEDDGKLEISAALITELLGYDYGGFPGITITRQSSDSADVPGGCADFKVTSTVSRLDVQVAGLISCNADTPCPNGMACQDDSTCQ